MIREDIFILTGEWQDINGRNIISLWGISIGHVVYEIVIDNVRPVFFVQRNFNKQNLFKIYKRKEVALKNFNGEDVDALYFYSQNELRKASQILENEYIHSYESDVDPVKRYLMERFINVQVNISGEPISRGKYFQLRNPVVTSSEITPVFKVASLDIETGKNGGVYSVAVYLKHIDLEIYKVFMLGEKTHKRNLKYIEYFNSENEMLATFIAWLNEADPDIIIGWHVIGFDLMFLEKRCQELGIAFNIGRGKSRIALRTRKSGGYFASIPGRIVIDGPPALRSAFYTFEDFKLETVAREILGTGKTITPEQNKIKEIERLFNDDKEKLAEYNLNDCILVYNIFQKTGLIEQSTKRAQLSGLFLDQLGMMTAAFDHFLLPRIHRAGYVAPNTKDIESTTHQAGGYVIDPKPGIYNDVIVLDFRSLYPSIIMTFKIDPLSRLLCDKDTITTPGGFRFSSTNNFLPDFISKLMIQRSEAKRKGDKYLSQAIKILMNSFYGVMGSYGCRFFHPSLPSAITSTGQWLLLGSKEFLENEGYEVLYGDTDSLFVKLKEKEDEQKLNAGSLIADRLNTYWGKKLKNDYGIESHLEIEYEKYYKKFILTPSRAGDFGAKKRYAGLLKEGDKEKLDFVGMEFVRSDWTRLAKDFQVELYGRIFNDKDVEDWIRNFVHSVMNGQLDHKLVYRKRLRRRIESYTKNVPPQVKAARLLGTNTNSINYIMTMRGPVPVELDHSDIDYQHYIDKQIKPIADSVLVLLGKSFDSITKSIQLNMFEE